jgi:hypothetical protein
VKRALMLVLALVTVVVAADRPAVRSYFTTDRPIEAKQPDRQNFLVIDDDIWAHARADLGDLRIYDSAGAEVPYALVTQGERSNTRPVQSKLFNLSKGPHGTEFVLEMYPELGEAREFDRVTLELTAKDFVGKAEVQASNIFNAPKWADVGTYSIFDFTREKLGKNFELRLPPMRFRFLRIVLRGPVTPDEVKGASVADFQREAASWVPVGSKPAIAQDGRTTVITWSQPEHAPLERVVFVVEGNTNLRRPVELQDDSGRQFATGEISRVHMAREGQVIDSRKLELDVYGAHAKQFKMLIQNGDDPPLDIVSVHPQSIERRLYFDPAAHTGLKLYYGDEKASAPVHDYAKIFQLQPNAARATLGAEEKNMAYTGRPDDRPWTERHQWVMWAALIAAVVVLGGIALRGMKA